MRSALLVICLACGADETPPESETTRETPTVEASTETVEVVEEAVPEDPSASWVELMHALPGTWVSTSNAYRNDPRQVARIADGDLETAWNSFSDVDDASIYVRVPEGAVIRAIELTVGYTKMHGRSDLFTGNRRLNRVRLRQPGEDGFQDATLDSDSRELQRIVLESPMTGDLEIQLTGFVPGSNADWSELCVSELRVLGEAPDAQPDSRTPMSFLGTLPPREAPEHAQRIFDRAREDAAEVEPMDLGQPLRMFSGVLHDEVAEVLELRVSGGACYSVVGEGRQRLPDDPEAYPYDIRVKIGERVWNNDATPQIAIGIDPDEICADTAQTMEIRVAPGTLASYWLHVFARTDATDGDVDDGDEDDDELDEEADDGSSDFMLSREGLHLTELTLGPSVENREVVDARATFSKADDERVYCLTRLDNPSREAATLYMGWERDDRPANASDRSTWGRELSIPAQPRYVTFGFRGTGQRAGRYRCVIRGQDGVVLGRANYELVE